MAFKFRQCQEPCIGCDLVHQTGLLDEQLLNGGVAGLRHDSAGLRLRLEGGGPRLALAPEPLVRPGPPGTPSPLGTLEVGPWVLQ